MPARDSLTIFVDGDEVPGMIAYGLRSPGQDLVCEFPADAWTAHPAAAAASLLSGDGWEVVAWEIPIVVWPSAADLRAALRRTLGALIKGGCRVAWAGAEGVPFCDPPQLFDTECMTGGVLAWLLDTGDYDCDLDPDAPLAPKSDDVLVRLREHAKGLADAPGPGHQS